MDKESFFLRGFMSIRTYALLALFAAMLAILLFSAGCVSPQAKPASGRSPGILSGNATAAVEAHATY